MNVQCPRCGSDARISVRPTWRQIAERVGAVALILGLIALSVLAPGIGVGLVMVVVIPALWAGVRGWWADQIAHDRYGWRFKTEAELNYDREYRRHRAQEREVEEIRAVLTKEPARVTIRCRLCGVVPCQ